MSANGTPFIKISHPQYFALENKAYGSNLS